MQLLPSLFFFMYSSPWFPLACVLTFTKERGDVRTLLVVQVINHAASEHRSILSEHLREESSILLRLRDESLIEF
jgi:hypothetical protein